MTVPSSSDRPDPREADVSRRAFFRRALLRGLDSTEAAGRRIGHRLGQFWEPAQDNAPPPPAPTARPVAAHVLRPPGAIPEPYFSDTCSRCGRCAEVCPAQAIILDPERAGGLPHIVARQAACVICSDLSCMKHCPSGALRLVEEPGHIRMGLAVVEKSLCLRSEGEACTVCVQQCPIGAAAITIGPDQHVQVHPGCTGCGVCERACPTEPAAIAVVPDH